MKSKLVFILLTFQVKWSGNAFKNKQVLKYYCLEILKVKYSIYTESKQ